MSRFREELRIIPRTAWFLALLVYVCSATLVFKYGILRDPGFRSWPLLGKIAFPYGIFLLVFALILLIGYVYADAKRRKMRYIMWNCLAILIPVAIGIIL